MEAQNARQAWSRHWHPARGLDGAGFQPKVVFVRAEDESAAILAVAMKVSPDTFKDRYYLERTPICFWKAY
jgi:hypothetical protein